MTLPANNITKSGTYDSTLEFGYTGTPMIFSENIGQAEGRYYATAWVYANILKGAQSLPRPGKTWYSGATWSSGATHLGNGYYDTTGGETWNPLVTSGSLDEYLPQGTWVLRWVGSCTARWTAEDYAWCASGSTQTNNLIAGQTHSDFDGTGANGTFAGGTNHAVNDVITFVSGATATVDAVSGGAVTQFTIDKTGDYNDDHGGGVATGDDGTQVAATADNQASTTGAGSGFNLTPGVNNILHRITYATNTTVNVPGGSSVATTNGTCTRLELLQPGNETRYDQGNIVAAQTVSDLAGFDVLRFMGIAQTNGNWFADFTEYPAYEDVEWYWGIPAKAIAKFCNECSAEPWVNVPHMFDGNNTAIDAYLQAIYDNLTDSQAIWLERSNEVWNSASAFKDQFSWTSRGDVAAQTATITLSTSLCTTSSPHGLTNGDPIIFFRTQEHVGQSGARAWTKYQATAGTYYAIVDSTTTFRIANTSAAVGRDADVTDSLDADYDAIADTSDTSRYTDMTYVRFKPEDTSVKTVNVNHAELSKALWDRGDTIFGRSRCNHVIMGQRTNAGLITDFMNVQDCREAVDYTGIACYWRFCDLGGAARSLNTLTMLVNSQDETNYDNTTKVKDAQDETDYDKDPEVEGEFNGGSGYNATETITLSDGTVLTIDAVSGGEVTEFTVDASSAADGTANGTTLTQSSTSGTGTGFTLTVRGYNLQFNGTFAGGTGHAVSDVIRLGLPASGVDVANNRINGLGTQTGADMRLQLESSGTLPAPLSTSEYYFVKERNTGTDYITLAADSDLGPEGDEIVLTDSGSGTHRIKGYVDVTVDAVSGGVVTQFTVNSTNDSGFHEPGTELVQIETTGSGTGFSLTPEAANIECTATVQDAYDFMVAAIIPQVMGQQQENINNTGRDILINYEGFDHQGSAVWSYNIPSIGALVESWGRDPLRKTFVERWCRELSKRNIKLCCHHSFVSDYDHSGVWGMMEHQGDTDAQEFQGMQTFLTASGAPKI